MRYVAYAPKTLKTLSKKSRYAFHGLAYIAAFSRGKPVPLDEILAYLKAYSQELALSPGYIAKIFQDVSRAGFVQAAQGPGGGYLLARDPATISMVEIIESLEGPMVSSCCLLAVGKCTRQGGCGVQFVIREAELAQYRIFERESLASLASKVDFPSSSVIDSFRTRKKPADQV